MPILHMRLSERVLFSPLVCLNRRHRTLSFRFVFDNFTWERDGPEFTEYNGKLIPSRIPLSTMISGQWYFL